MIEKMSWNDVCLISVLVMMLYLSTRNYILRIFEKMMAWAEVKRDKEREKWENNNK